MSLNKIITLKEAAKEHGDILGSYRTLQNRIYKKKIPYYRIGNKLFINPHEVLMECRIPSVSSQKQV